MLSFLRAISAPVQRPRGDLSAGFRRAFSSSPIGFPKPAVDLDYILDSANYEEIKLNILSRKGVGDLDKVIAISEQCKKDPNNSDLFAAFAREAAKIPNRTHHKAAALGKECRVLDDIPWEAFKELPKVRSFEELSRILFGVRGNNLTHFSGEKTYYLRDAMAELEQALVEYAVSRLTKEWGFTLVSVPDILSPEVVAACGMTTDGDLTQVYHFDEADHGRLALSGTSEMSLAGMLINQELNVSPGKPLKYAAVSRCFRAESSKAAAERSIYRVHHFTKVEMFGVTAGNQQASDELLEDFLRIQRSLYGDLGLSFRVLDMPPHELGAPACRKFDIEALFPSKAAEGGGNSAYGEISSCSNCTDYQSRRLNIKDRQGLFVHTVNGTAIAAPRLMMALCEQNQLESGGVFLPRPLQGYMRGVDVLRQVSKKNRLNLVYVQSPRYFVEKCEKKKRKKTAAVKSSVN